MATKTFKQRGKKEFVFNKEKAVKVLQDLWGKDFEKNIHRAAFAFENFFNDADKALLTKTRMGQDPEFIKSLARFVEEAENQMEGQKPGTHMFNLQQAAARRHVADRIPALVRSMKNKWVSAFGPTAWSDFDGDAEIEVLDDDSDSASQAASEADLMAQRFNPFQAPQGEKDTGTEKKVETGPARDPATGQPMLEYGK